MNSMTQPTIVNPNFVIELENTGRLCTDLANSFRKLGGISIGGHQRAPAVTRKHSASTIRKMRIAAQNRKLQVHQGGKKAA